MNQLESKVADMEALIDRQNQYSRRNCLRLSGVSETQGENTDTTVTKILSAIGANISIDEIDRSHRLGKPRKSPSSSQAQSRNPLPRDIIIKFTSYRARQKVYMLRSKL